MNLIETEFLIAVPTGAEIECDFSSLLIIIFQCVLMVDVDAELISNIIFRIY